jgi:hypothetical protein
MTSNDIRNLTQKNVEKYEGKKLNLSENFLHVCKNVYIARLSHSNTPVTDTCKAPPTCRRKCSSAGSESFPHGHTAVQLQFRLTDAMNMLRLRGSASARHLLERQNMESGEFDSVYPMPLQGRVQRRAGPSLGCEEAQSGMWETESWFGSPQACRKARTMGFSDSWTCRHPWESQKSSETWQGKQGAPVCLRGGCA